MTRFKALFAGSLLVFGLATTGPTQAETEAGAKAPASDTVTIRYLRSRGQISAPEIAEAKGWLKAEGVALESQGFSQGGPESLFALASGSVDIAGAAVSATINAIANGADNVAILASNGVNNDVKSKFFVLQDSPIHTPQDLIGKTIAVNTLGAHLDYVIREYLYRNDIPYKSVRLVTVPGPQLEQTLRSGQVDVAAVGAWQTVFSGKLESGGGVRVAFNDHDILGDITLSPYSMSRDFVNQHPEAVQAFVTQSARAADWTRQHPEEARALIARLLTKRGENPELASYWQGLGVRDHALLSKHDVNFWLTILEREGGLPKGKLSPEDIYTNQFNEFAPTNLAQTSAE